MVQQAECWLPVNPDHLRGINVAAQMESIDSLWHYYRDLLRLRKSLPALVIGDFVEQKVNNKDVFGFIRSTNSQKLFVLLNLGTAQCKVPASKGAKILFRSAGGVERLPDDTISLNPFTGAVLSSDE
jgi:glycosidase